jgi:hypothetical protein
MDQLHIGPSHNVGDTSLTLVEAGAAYDRTVIRPGPEFMTPVRLRSSQVSPPPFFKFLSTRV